MCCVERTAASDRRRAKSGMGRNGVKGPGAQMTIARKEARLSTARLLFASIAGAAALYFAWGLYRVLA